MRDANLAMFKFKTAFNSATETGATINFLHLAAEQRQRQMWEIIMPHFVRIILYFYDLFKDTDVYSSNVTQDVSKH